MVRCGWTAVVQLLNTIRNRRNVGLRGDGIIVRTTVTRIVGGLRVAMRMGVMKREGDAMPMGVGKRAEGAAPMGAGNTGGAAMRTGVGGHRELAMRMGVRIGENAMRMAVPRNRCLGKMCVIY